MKDEDYDPYDQRGRRVRNDRTGERRDTTYVTNRSHILYGQVVLLHEGLTRRWESPTSTRTWEDRPGFRGISNIDLSVSTTGERTREGCHPLREVSLCGRDSKTTVLRIVGVEGDGITQKNWSSQDLCRVLEVPLRKMNGPPSPTSPLSSRTGRHWTV